MGEEDGILAHSVWLVPEPGLIAPASKLRGLTRPMSTVSGEGKSKLDKILEGPRGDGTVGAFKAFFWIQLSAIELFSLNRHRAVQPWGAICPLEALTCVPFDVELMKIHMRFYILTPHCH